MFRVNVCNVNWDERKFYVDIFPFSFYRASKPSQIPNPRDSIFPEKAQNCETLYFIKKVGNKYKKSVISTKSR